MQSKNQEKKANMLQELNSKNNFTFKKWQKIKTYNQDKSINFYKKFIKNYLSLNKKYFFNKEFLKSYIFNQIINIDTKKNYNLKFLPIGIKDNINTKFLSTNYGLRSKKKFMAGNNANIVDKIINNGGLIFSKTNCAEYAVHHISEKLNINPYDDKFIAGTSSTGSAIAVSCGALPVAIGTQTAGSIIRPASYCGVIGYKPTFGTISRTGVLKTADTLDTIGFFSNYIEDLQMIFDSTRQKGLNYPITNKKIDKVKSNLKRKKKIGILIGPKTKNANSSLLSSLEKIIKNTQNNNLVFEEYKLSNFFNDAHYFHKVLYTKSLSYYLKNEFKDNQEKLSKSLSNMILYGKELSLSDYQKAIDYQKKLILKLDKIFNKYDFLIDLSTFSSAPNYNSNGIEDHNLIWTMGHIPSISLPIIKDNKGLPVGVQLNSKRYNDYELLEISKFFYEKN